MADLKSGDFWAGSIQPNKPEPANKECLSFCIASSRACRPQFDKHFVGVVQSGRRKQVGDRLAILSPHPNRTDLVSCSIESAAGVIV
jgi:hypothetical protein